MKMYRGVEIQYHAILTSVLDGGQWSASCSGPEGKAPDAHWIGGSMLFIYLFNYLICCQYHEYTSGDCWIGKEVEGSSHKSQTVLLLDQPVGWAGCFSEVVVTIYQVTWCHVPEDHNFNIVTHLLRALLSNGSVNKPQQRDCFLWSPRREHCYATQR
jgi:hypothetical protein